MHSSYSVASVACCAVFTFLGTVAVLLRQYAQSLKKQPMTADAWFFLAGLVCYAQLIFVSLSNYLLDYNLSSRWFDHLRSRRWWIRVADPGFERPKGVYLQEGI